MALPSLTKLPAWAQIFAFVALGVGSAVAFYIYYEMPTRADMSAREQQLTALRSDISRGLNTTKKLPEFRAQVAELEGRLDTLRAVLPEDKDAADLLFRLQTVAAQSSLTIKGFRPGTTVNKQLHSEWPIQIELEGTYHNLAIFFDKVGKFTRIVNINNVDVRGKDKPEANGATITASCTATTFVLLDKPQQGKAGAKPGAATPPPAGAKG